MTVPDTSATTPTHIGEEARAVLRARSEAANVPFKWSSRLQAWVHGVTTQEAALEDFRAAMDPTTTIALLDALDAAERSLASLLADLKVKADEWERLAAGNEASRGKATKVAGYYRRLAAQLRSILAEYTPDTTTGGKP